MTFSLAKFSVHPFHLIVVSNAVERYFSNMLRPVSNLLRPEPPFVGFVEVGGSIRYQSLRLFSIYLPAELK